MAQVTIRINGYSYTVGCEDGQEGHLQAMARHVDERVESVRELGGQSGEARMLVLASLLMADEIHDLRVERDQLQVALTRRQSDTQAGAEAAARPRRARNQALARKLNQLADNAEHIAAGLDPS